MATSLLYMLVVWGLVTVALIVVATYRSVVAQDETDRLIVSQAESHLAMQQREVIAKVSQLDQFVNASHGPLARCWSSARWSGYGRASLTSEVSHRPDFASEAVKKAEPTSRVKKLCA
jgi:erythromycin esterase-like protein